MTSKMCTASTSPIQECSEPSKAVSDVVSQGCDPPVGLGICRVNLDEHNCLPQQWQRLFRSIDDMTDSHTVEKIAQRDTTPYDVGIASGRRYKFAVTMKRSIEYAIRLICFAEPLKRGTKVVHGCGCLFASWIRCLAMQQRRTIIGYGPGVVCLLVSQSTPQVQQPASCC